jgi:hypothetical protein
LPSVPPRPSCYRIHPRIPGIRTICQGDVVTVETCHGISRIVFFVVTALANAVSGEDGIEVELKRIRQQ